LINHFVKNNLLKPIVDAFLSNGDRYNLLNSAILELFEYIRKVTLILSPLFFFHLEYMSRTIHCGVTCFIQENLKLLLKYIVDSFWNDLVKFEHLTSIQALKVKYEQVFFTSIQFSLLYHVSLWYLGANKHSSSV
jgi:protein phosphatase-4 regulatory subunit 3